MAKTQKTYIITGNKGDRTYVSRSMTIEQAVEYYGYTLEKGAAWSVGQGFKQINRTPATISALIKNLDNAEHNTNGVYGMYYTYVETTNGVNQECVPV